jgi:DNA-binding NarL/FixJ family response regulator
MSVGACGYVVKSDAGLDLLPAIAAVHNGRTFVSRTLGTREWT